MSRALPHSLFIGTSGAPKDGNKGIYFLTLDVASGKLGEARLAAETPNPGFLAQHPTANIVYAAGESGRIDEKSAAGAVNAYACDAAAGTLGFVNQVPTGGKSVTHLVADATGRMVCAASYHGGQVSAFAVAGDGRLESRTVFLETSGQLGPNRARQDKPHPHCVTLSPRNQRLVVCDLGLDRLFLFRVEPGRAALTPEAVPAVPVEPGSGPRHCKFSADGRFLYVINELGSSIHVFRVADDSTPPVWMQAIATLPAGFSGENICAEIQIHPNGRLVFGSNRGHDSIAVFARDEATGRLEAIAHTPCGGRHPRHFALSADGAWLVCANRDTHNLAAFRVDPATGRLTPTSQAGGIPVPTCVLFARQG